MDQPGTPDEIERQIRQIEAELAQPAKFTEPSAAERASKPQATRLSPARMVAGDRGDRGCRADGLLAGAALFAIGAVVALVAINARIEAGQVPGH
jgi:hypothetical protein